VIRTTGSLPRHAGSKMLVWADGRIVGTVGGGAMEARVIQDALAALADGQTHIVSYTLNDLKDGDPGICGGTVELFVEPLSVPPTLVVIGCGHVGKALAELGKWMNYRVIVSDDRAEFCNPQFIPNMDGYVLAAPAEAAKQIALGPQTYVAAVTRGMPIDLELFPPLWPPTSPTPPDREPPPLGADLEGPLERGFGEEQLRKVRSPIGLELNAETPKEIAISIMAEITMLRRGGTGQPMQFAGAVEAAE
jgi:xanthine dehydrogenase accessory factor